MLKTKQAEEIALPAHDYDAIAQVIETLSVDYQKQPSLDDLSRRTKIEATDLQKLFYAKPESTGNL